MPTHQQTSSSTYLLVRLVNKSPRQLIYLSRSSTNLLVNLLLVTLVNKSSRQLTTCHARQQISSSTYLLVRSSTNLLVNLSTCPLVNKSPRQLVNSSTRQLKKTKNQDIVKTTSWLLHVGITGLEPATPSSRTTCATNCAKSRLP